MTTVIEYLESFNRKERFFLVARALGNPRFRLGEEFRKELGYRFGLQIPEEDVFVAMDYHFDWIQTSLYLYGHAQGDGAVYSNRGDDGGKLITGNQEDIDLIVAFASNETTHIMLIEAKAETGWGNLQMKSKANRLGRIFGDGKRGDAVPNVLPHFALMSPRRHKRLLTTSWPQWMRPESGEPFWLELPVLPGRRKVTRTDASGRPAQSGQEFTVQFTKKTDLEPA